jgi:hypothetical protein
MTKLWIVLGILVGANTAAPDGNLLAVISGAIAGVLVLPWLGVVFGLLGGRVWDTVVGAACGCLLGAGLAALSSQVPVPYLANVGLLGGAMGGATLSATVRRLRQAVQLLAVKS